MMAIFPYMAKAHWCCQKLLDQWIKDVKKDLLTEWKEI